MVDMFCHYSLIVDLPIQNLFVAGVFSFFKWFTYSFEALSGNSMNYSFFFILNFEGIDGVGLGLVRHHYSLGK